MEFNYEQDLHIDETALDVECLDQAKLMFRYAKNEALRRKEWDESKQNLDIVQAEIDFLVRKTPADYGVDKVTETVVNGVVIRSEKYKSAYQVTLEAKYEYEMAKGAATAFEQRKNMLETLVKLHGQQYFAGPSIPRDIRKEKESRLEKVNSSIATKLKRTVK